MTRKTIAVLDAGANGASIGKAVTEIAHRIERGELKPGPDNLALLRALAASGG